MDKLFVLMLFFLIIVSFLYLYLFYFYLYKQYKKAETNYYNKQISTKRYCLKTREELKNKKIKDNVTTIIDSELINSLAGYALIEFVNERGEIIRTQTIRKSCFKIGRGEANDIVLRGQTVSRYQCSIICKNNSFSLYNYSQSNPTLLNDIAINGHSKLFFDDVIKIANYTLRFREIVYETKPCAG